MLKNQKKWTAMAALIMGVIVALPAWAEFLSALPEIPLAPGLQENRDAALIFDKPSGRIVTGEALSARPADEILNFYRTALPNFGWQLPAQDWFSPSSQAFTRGGESLTIRVEGGVVFFKLQPRP